MTDDDHPRQQRPPGIGRKQWRVIILSSLGGALEFYDFVIYSMFAQYIGAAFFPATNQLESLMYSFSVFAVGYLARPLGGVVFSHFGDKYGRRRVFIIPFSPCPLRPSAWACCRSQAAIGSADHPDGLPAPGAGFQPGGELPGAITFVVETAPRTAGFAAGFIFFCVNSGVALASRPEPDRARDPERAGRSAARAGASASWSAACWASSASGCACRWRRPRISAPEASGRARVPFLELLRTHPPRCSLRISTMIATAAFNGLLFAMPSFLPQAMRYTRQRGHPCAECLSGRSVVRAADGGLARRSDPAALDSRRWARCC